MRRFLPPPLPHPLSRQGACACATHPDKGGPPETGCASDERGANKRCPSSAQRAVVAGLLHGDWSDVCVYVRAYLYLFDDVKRWA